MGASAQIMRNPQKLLGILQSIAVHFQRSNTCKENYRRSRGPASPDGMCATLACCERNGDERDQKQV
jgi:hypothetical protein